MFAPPMPKTKGTTAGMRAHRRSLLAREADHDVTEQEPRRPRSASAAEWDFTKVLVTAADRPAKTEPLGPVQARLQPKLRMGRTDDPLEHEADRIADQVTRLSEARFEPAHPAGQVYAPVQRNRALSAETGQIAPPLIDEVLRSPGQPLDPAIRATMEPRFGHDFSRVRVHTDTSAMELARLVDALAYTVGHHVVFGSGRYAPQSLSGGRLLAHELTHVVQQANDIGRAQSVQRAPEKKPKPRDVVVIGEDWKGSEELARVLGSGALVIRVKSVHEFVMKLAKIDFPIGTLYIVTHSAPDGALQFGTAEGPIGPADIASKLKGALSAENGPEVLDFRGCSVGTSPPAMQQIGAVLNAKSVIAGHCFAVIQRSIPVSIGGKSVTKSSDVAGAATDEATKKQRRDLFTDLLKKNADKFGDHKKCIMNPGESGYFAAGGHFVALWFNPEDNAEFTPGKSICYKDVAPETVDPSKALAASGHCRLIRVEETGAGEHK